jgi:hypothetical protein
MVDSRSSSKTIPTNTTVGRLRAKRPGSAPGFPALRRRSDPSPLVADFAKGWGTGRQATYACTAGNTQPTTAAYCAAAAAITSAWKIS